MARTTRELEGAAPRSAVIGALALFCPGEVYRSTVWQKYLDNRTNWAVVMLGIGFSLTFSGKDASPLPLVFVGILIVLFLGIAFGHGRRQGWLRKRRNLLAYRQRLQFAKVYRGSARRGVIS